jgi:hypothetical protein
MRAGHRLFGRRLGHFLIAAASAVTIFLGIAVVLGTFESLGGVQLTQADGKAKPKDKCKPKDDGNTDDNNNGSGSGQPNKKPCPTPSPSPSPTCTPGGYGVPPGCPTPPSVPGTTVLGGTTVAGGQTSMTGETGTASTTTGSTTPKDSKSKGKGGAGAGSATTGEAGSGSKPETVVLGSTLTRPEGSSEEHASGQPASARGTELFGWVVPLEGTSFGLAAISTLTAVAGFLLLLFKRRKRSI